MKEAGDYYYKAVNDLLVKNPRHTLVVKFADEMHIEAINEDAFRVFKNLESGTAFTDLVEKLGVRSSSLKLQEFLGVLVEKGFVAKDLSLEGMHKRSPLPFDQRLSQDDMPLERIFFEATDGCNLRCNHCYQDFQGKANTVPLEQVIELVDAAAEIGAWQFDVTGGEFFVRKDAGDILEYLAKKRFAVNIFTNATLISQREIDMLKGFNHINRIFTSLHYSTEEGMDRFVGRKGIFRKIIDTIKLLKDNGFNVVVSTSVFEENYHCVEDIVKIVMDLGCFFRVSPVLPVGRGHNYQYENYRMISGILREVNEKYREHEYFANLRYDYPRQTSCGLAESFIYVEASGMISVCPTLSSREREEFVLGSLSEPYDLAKIWRESQMLKNFRDHRCEAEDCEHHGKCLSGCRSRALIGANNWEAYTEPDIFQCYYCGRDPHPA